MSRSTQFIGLNFKAENFIKMNAQKISKTEPCPHCGQNYTHEEYLTKELKEVLGMFEEPVHTLLQYTTKDGKKFEEFKQCSPWSSGPMIFLALRWSDTKEPIKESLWDDSTYDENRHYEYDRVEGIINV